MRIDNIETAKKLFDELEALEHAINNFHDRDKHEGSIYLNKKYHSDLYELAKRRILAHYEKERERIKFEIGGIE